MEVLVKSNSGVATGAVLMERLLIFNTEWSAISISRLATLSLVNTSAKVPTLPGVEPEPQYKSPALPPLESTNPVVP